MLSLVGVRSKSPLNKSFIFNSLSLFQGPFAVLIPCVSGSGRVDAEKWYHTILLYTEWHLQWCLIMNWKYMYLINLRNQFTITPRPLKPIIWHIQRAFATKISCWNRLLFVKKTAIYITKNSFSSNVDIGKIYIWSTTFTTVKID